MSNRPLSKSLGIVAFCALSCSLSLPTAAWADIYVVISPQNAQRPFTRQEVVDLFLGRDRNFSGGGAALPLDLPRDNPVRRAFYLELTGMSPAQLGNYWRQLAISGQTMPPQVLPDEAEVARAIKDSPSAVGYLSLDKQPVDKGLRIVFSLRSAK
jgi:hypothetical protein